MSAWSPNSTVKQPFGDTAAAIAFLIEWGSAGPCTLTAIDPENGALETRTFRGDQMHEAATWIDRFQGNRNLYFSVNRPKRHLNKKAKKEDIGWMRAPHVDVDPRVGHELPAEQERIVNLLREYILRPSIIVFSGGGYQAYWLLKEAIAVDDPERLEAYNKHLASALGGDNCQNIDRIMRLPGTINLPDAKKRAKGRQIALARVIEADWNRRYSLENFTALLSASQTKSEGSSTLDIDALAVSARIKKLIRGISDPKHPYKSRSEASMAVLVAMAAAGCSNKEMESLFLDARIPISAHVLDQAKPPEYLKRQIAEARKFVSDPAIEALNKIYAVVLVGGTAAVMREGLSGDGRPEITLMGVDSFKQWLANQRIFRGGEWKRLADFWLTHRQRRQYQGLVFAPGREVPGHFNLWQGFAVEPKPGDCSRFLAHLRDNICHGDEALYQWVVGWFADLFQNPQKKKGTSLAIRGKQGAGKTIVGETVGSLLGEHYVLVSDPRYITGRFNSHLVRCLLLHADEAFWAGDHSAEGKLKDLITGDIQLVEYKGKEPFRVRNFVRLLVTGNAEWMVPAWLQERRFAVLDAGEAHIQDHEYFAAIVEEMDHGGREALLHFFLHYDLSGINLRKIPKTAALLEQKFASLTTEQGWLLDKLMTGRLSFGGRVPGETPRKYLFKDYIKHAKDQGSRRRSIETRIGILLNKYVPGLRKCEGLYTEADASKTTGPIYVFPPLAVCRASFANEIQQEIAWGDPEEWLLDSTLPEPDF